MVTPLMPEGLSEWLEIDEEKMELKVKEDAPDDVKKEFKEWLKDMEESMKI